LKKILKLSGLNGTKEPPSIAPHSWDGAWQITAAE
jgi:hypothetical protein